MKEIFNMINRKPEPMTILISLVAALLLSMILYGAYRLANTKESYQPQFAVTLVTMALISTVLMDLIQSNLALSLGMLGSLSIVRFRTNIKDTRDIGFIFWSMAIGLAAATQSYFIGAAGSLMLACVMIGTKKKSGKAGSYAYGNSRQSYGFGQNAGVGKRTDRKCKDKSKKYSGRVF